jgi:hypothetical protein
MDSPKLTVAELLEDMRDLRASHAREVERLTKTLRDHFAKAALAPVMAARLALDAGDMNQESIAEECYELADAMLTAREAQS